MIRAFQGWLGRAGNQILVMSRFCLSIYHDLLPDMKDPSVIDLEVELDLGGGSSRSFPVDLRRWEKEIRESVKPAGAK